MRKNISLTAKEFNRIIEKNVKPTIVSYFKRRGFNINEYTVDEVVSMFDEKLAKSIDKYDETKSQGAWFSTIALHSAYDYITDEYRWNKHNQSMSIVDKDGDYSEMEFSDYRSSDNTRPDNMLASSEILVVLDKALNMLSEEDALIIRLKMKGYSNEEIGEEFGINDGAVRTKICRVRKRFKEIPVIAKMYAEIFGDTYIQAA
jgi:RNA polymerase sigma factor (sigma-70 family)